ncbi:MAG: SPASM domain-containing protein [Anaerovoracaceae bacterium]
MKDKKFELCEDETEVLLDVIKKSKKLSLKLELLSFNMQPFAMVCYAARKNAWLIDYDGKIKKCTSSLLDDPTNEIGDLEHGISETGYKKAAKWTSYDLPERCRECEILPICYGRKCPVGVDYFYVNKDEK